MDGSHCDDADGNMSRELVLALPEYPLSTLPSRCSDECDPFLNGATFAFAVDARRDEGTNAARVVHDVNDPRADPELAITPLIREHAAANARRNRNVERGMIVLVDA